MESEPESILNRKWTKTSYFAPKLVIFNENWTVIGSFELKVEFFRLTTFAQCAYVKYESLIG